MKSDRMKVELYNGTQLALAMGVHRNYISAMKRAGYKFTHGFQTTLDSAMNWRATHPDFTRSTVYPRNERRAA